MESSTILRTLLRSPPPSRTLLTLALRPQSRFFALAAALPHTPTRHISTPRILQPSFWRDMIPRPLRPGSSENTIAAAQPDQPKAKKEWNPATPYIILAMLVGSQAIQTLWLKQERSRDLRRAEAKIGVLREVIERVQRGEDVDVEKVLGSGVEGEEEEWTQVLKDIEEEELLFQSKKQRRAARRAAEVEGEKEKVEEAQEIVDDGGKAKVETIDGAKFY
ncbi:hypothetical protein BS50DRAFT_571242 [Corynespora cassiicola Philippines]|uniref:Uncharacterized protein n=1 Tax=Corynespora cassiicola Philippines TaxID=1448308 RepID=A0A2T2NWX5_CORCC|nr:hypothetical protein BS50DRAFT_571242 [Corynespora cassiicola Philippines]